MQSSSRGYTHFGLCLFDNQLIVEVDNQVLVEVFAKKPFFEFMFCPGQISVTIKDRDTGFFCSVSKNLYYRDYTFGIF